MKLLLSLLLSCFSIIASELDTGSLQKKESRPNITISQDDLCKLIPKDVKNRSSYGNPLDNYPLSIEIWGKKYMLLIYLKTTLIMNGQFDLTNNSENTCNQNFENAKTVGDMLKLLPQNVTFSGEYPQQVIATVAGLPPLLSLQSLGLYCYYQQFTFNGNFLTRFSMSLKPLD